MKLRQRQLHRSGACVAISTTLLVLAITAMPVSAQGFMVEYADDKLSVQANNIRVKELLLEIQNKTGIPVNFIADPKDTISLEVSEQTVENVIARITENHMIIHDTVNGKKTISELIIISEDPELTSSGSSANLPSGQPAPAIATESTEPSSEAAESAGGLVQDNSQGATETSSPTPNTN